MEVFISHRNEMIRLDLVENVSDYPKWRDQKLSNKKFIFHFFPYFGIGNTVREKSEKKTDKNPYKNVWNPPVTGHRLHSINTLFYGFHSICRRIHFTNENWWYFDVWGKCRLNGDKNKNNNNNNNKKRRQQQKSGSRTSDTKIELNFTNKLAFQIPWISVNPLNYVANPLMCRLLFPFSFFLFFQIRVSVGI